VQTGLGVKMDAHSLAALIQTHLQIDASRFVYVEMVEIADIITEALSLCDDISNPGTFDDHEDTRCFTTYYLNLNIADRTRYPKASLERLRELDRELADFF